MECTFQKRDEKVCRKNRKLRNKKAILEAALKLFAHKSYASITMKDISETCGLGMGSIYTIFKTKEEIFFTAFAEKNKELNLAIKKVMPSSFKSLSKLTYWKTFESILKTIVDFCYRNPDFINIILFDRSPIFWSLSPEYLNKLNELHLETFSFLHSLIQYGQNCGFILNEISYKSISRKIIGVIDSTFFYNTFFQEKMSFKEIFHDIKTFILYGVKNR